MDTTVQKILAKLFDGLLPNQAPVRSWGGYGSGQPCHGCDEPIISTEVEHELDFKDWSTVRFHAACDAIWQQLKNPADPPLSA